MNSDVLHAKSEIVLAIYDRENQETFYGMVRVRRQLNEEGKIIDDWFPLQPRSEAERSSISGEIQLQIIRIEQRLRGERFFENPVRHSQQ